jgi:hypothetical protein
VREKLGLLDADAWNAENGNALAWVPTIGPMRLSLASLACVLHGPAQPHCLALM